jgi:microcystin-dependent protein
MATPFLGQIQIVGFNFAPTGWATCDGQLLPINQNSALFSILGTTYGGDGRQTFGLPNLRDRTPLGAGQGPGLSPYGLGQVDGSENVTLLAGQMPAHRHGLVGDGDVSASGTPTGTEVFGVTKGAKPGAVNVYGPAANANTAAMDPSALSTVGGGQPHNNRQPYVGILFIIAMQGIFPARN